METNDERQRLGRFEALDRRPVNLDGFAGGTTRPGSSRSPRRTIPSPPVGFDEDGRVVELDGVAGADFDFLDEFIAAHGIDLAVAAEAMALDDLAFARLLVDPERAARRGRPAGGRHDAGEAHPRPRPATPGRAGDGDDQDARPPHAQQPGARDQPARRPAAARRRRRHRGRLRLPRGRDHRAGARRRAVQRRRRARSARRSAPPACSCSARSRRPSSSSSACAASCRTPRPSPSTAPSRSSSTATTPRGPRRSSPRPTPRAASRCASPAAAAPRC